uniref:Uncharacterized protein n=1 Tax=Panagrolaimus sp. JU765 TaxID=591449 RepID=A0AC34RSN7_9BILA
MYSLYNRGIVVVVGCVDDVVDDCIIDVVVVSVIDVVVGCVEESLVTIGDVVVFPVTNEFSIEQADILKHFDDTHDEN